MNEIKINFRQIEERKKILDWFQNIQLTKLLENSHKGTWRNKSVEYLLKRLKEEVVELEEAIKIGSHTEIARESADVSIFALFIADKICNGR